MENPMNNVSDTMAFLVEIKASFNYFKNNFRSK